MSPGFFAKCDKGSLPFKSRPQSAVLSALLLCGLLLALCLNPAHASTEGDTYLRRVWTTDSGLPQNSVTSLLQTRDGYLWLGTFGGLVRFDGMSFVVFNTANTSQLRSNRIRALYEDPEGDLWIAAEHGGLTRYRNGVFRNYSLRDGLPSDSVLSLAGDGAGGLWIGTLRGLARFHDGRITAYVSEAGVTGSGLPSAGIDALYRDNQGNVWIGAHGVGLIRFRAGVATVYAENNPADGGKSKGIAGDIWAIDQTREGMLLVGAGSGLSLFDPAEFSVRDSIGSSQAGVVQSIYEGKDGAIWFASNLGVFRLVDEPGNHLATAEKLSDTGTRSILLDREQNVWVGSEAGGLGRWRTTNVRVLTAAQGLTNQPAMAIFQSGYETGQCCGGTIWIGTIAGRGLFSYKDGKVSSYRPRSGQIDSPASLAEDHGHLWLGDWRYGLERLDLKQSTVQRLAVPGMSGDVVRALYVDSSDALWIGSDQNGLFRLKDGKFTHYGARDGLISNSVAFLTQDRAGALWIGTPLGISRFRNGAFTSFRSPGMLLVRAIHEDKQGALWIGTYGYGLFRFKSGKFSRIDASDGLFDDVVSSVLEDDRGNFWMSGNRGIFRASQSTLNDFADGRVKRVECVSYGTQDGMTVSESNGGGEPSGLRASDGKLWFPMIKGVVIIDAAIVSSQPPPVDIQQVLVDGKPVSMDRPIRIPRGQHNLEIDYSALDLSRPEKVLFRYRMDGLDRDWVDAGTRRAVYFSHLPSGKYTFRLIAENGDGAWNMTGRSLPVEVLQPIWANWWFIALEVLALIGLAAFAHTFRTARLARAHAAQEAFSRKLLDSQEHERQRIAAELHDSLGQSLLIIKNRAVLALGSLRDPETTREQLEEISAGASQAVEEVREISYNLRPYQLDRFGLTKALRGLCMQAAKSSGIRFQADIDEMDGSFTHEAESSIYRIVQEAVNNIIKHSQAAQASVMLRREGNDVHLRIQDDGRGFSRVQTNGAETVGGGFGLIGMAERVRMLGGNYSMESALSSGTTITIRLPVDERIRS